MVAVSMLRLSKIFRLLGVLVISGALITTVGIGAIYWSLFPDLPSIDRLREVQLHVPLRVYTADGALMAEFGEKRRMPVNVSEVPKPLIQAVLAAEDDRFFEHPGVDWQGITRAVLHVLRTGEKGPGGSTITMQVARNFFLTREKTYARKLNEILLALKIEREIGKDEILELYLNKIFLGHRAYGVGAASQVYYGKPLAELSLAQTAMIAGLPKAPSKFNPIANPERAVERRNYVLGRMRELNFIADEVYQHGQGGARERTHSRSAYRSAGGLCRGNGARLDGRALRRRRLRAGFQGVHYRRKPLAARRHRSAAQSTH